MPKGRSIRIPSSKTQRWHKRFDGELSIDEVTLAFYTLSAQPKIAHLSAAFYNQQFDKQLHADLSLLHQRNFDHVPLHNVDCE